MVSLQSKYLQLEREYKLLENKLRVTIDANAELQDLLMDRSAKLTKAKRVINLLKDRINFLKGPLRRIYEARAELKNKVLNYKLIRDMIYGKR